jgi:sporulation protein YlmC with PRC-barrel domain
MRLQLGRPVRCSDNAVRELADVVLDSGGRHVTHLVVRPHQRPEAARLVPVGLAEPDKSPDGQVSLRCTEDLLEELEPVHEFAYLLPGQQPETDGNWDVGVEDMYPSYENDPSDFGEGVGGDYGVGVFYDRVPRGEIELRHASSVYSADGHHVGQVDGLVLDEHDRVTHLLLARGHFLWRREISVPNDAVSRFETDLVTLSVPKSGLRSFSSRRLR